MSVIGGREFFREVKVAEGAYGDVWKCREHSSDLILALK